MEMTSQYAAPRKLYKSRTNRMIDGVCGGVAEYFELDPTIVRVVWVLFTLLGGTGIILYIVAMIVMPVNPYYSWATPPPDAVPPNMPPPPGAPSVRMGMEGRRFWGITLILVGALILMAKLGASWFDWFDLSWEFAFPIVLIIIGAWFIFMYMRPGTVPPAGEPGAGVAGQADPAAVPGAAAFSDHRELRRSLTDRKLFGVCGGIAKHFNIDPTIVRVGYVALVIASAGWALLLYIVLAFLIPEERVSDIR